MHPWQLPVFLSRGGSPLNHSCPARFGVQGLTVRCHAVRCSAPYKSCSQLLHESDSPLPHHSPANSSWYYSLASDGTPPTLNAHTWIRRETSNKDGHEGSARKKNASPPTCLPACVPAVHGADKRMDTLLLYLTTHPTIYVSIRKSTHPPTPHHAVTHTLLAQSALKETLPSITLRYLVERVTFNLLLPPSLPPLCQGGAPTPSHLPPLTV